MLTAIVLIAVAAIVAFSITLFVRAFRDATGTVWQRLIAASADSATVLWSYIVAASGALLAWSVTAADFLNLPEVRTFIDGHLKVEYVGVALTVIALVTIVARLRTLLKV